MPAKATSVVCGNTLEIMSPGPVHEYHANLMSEMLTFVLDEWEIDYANSGQTTFQVTAQESGCEAGKSYSIANLKKPRDLKNIDLNIDPHPI